MKFSIYSLIASVCAMIALFVSDTFFTTALLPSGLNWLQFSAILFGVIAMVNAFVLLTTYVLAKKKRPAAEAMMISRLYWLVGGLAFLIINAYGFGVLKAFGTAFSLFGGMLLGWSLQAPVSGFAAWILVSMKRPFRPGDRVQFPGLGLTGDIKEIGVMYMILDQVGGSVNSEEAVGRDILVPNVMLFSQVVINYTVKQDTAYLLDEVVVRITYGSDWAKAEKILLDAAVHVTKDVITFTGMQPYIRSDMYEYGVHLRLRYYTWAKRRAETTYEMNKLIFEGIQSTPSVDLAIPYVYSFRSAHQRKDSEKNDQAIQYVEIDQIVNQESPPTIDVLTPLASDITANGLLQPIVIRRRPNDSRYDVIAGHLRLEACKMLKWKHIPALVYKDNITQITTNDI